MDDATRLDVANAAVADLLADWLRHGGPAHDVRVWLDDGGEVCIHVDGGGTTPSAWGDGPAALAASVTDHLHAELVDAAHRVVLLCPVHGCGLHPVADGARPVWRCSVGAHAVGPVGALPVDGHVTGSAGRRRQAPRPVLVGAVDPEHSLLEQDEAVYQVHFWSRPAGADAMWRREEYRLERAADLRDVLAWAEREASGRLFTVYVEAVVDDELSLLHLTGDDPTRLPSPSVQLEVVLTDGVDPDAVAALVAAAGQSGRYALVSGDGPPWRAVFPIPFEDSDAVGGALVSRLRDEGYRATLTSWD